MQPGSFTILNYLHNVHFFSSGHSHNTTQKERSEYKDMVDWDGQTAQDSICPKLIQVKRKTTTGQIKQ